MAAESMELPSGAGPELTDDQVDAVVARMLQKLDCEYQECLAATIMDPEFQPMEVLAPDSGAFAAEEDEGEQEADGQPEGYSALPQLLGDSDADQDDSEAPPEGPEDEDGFHSGSGDEQGGEPRVQLNYAEMLALFTETEDDEAEELHWEAPGFEGPGESGLGRDHDASREDGAQVDGARASEEKTCGAADGGNAALNVAAEPPPPLSPSSAGAAGVLPTAPVEAGRGLSAEQVEAIRKGMEQLELPAPEWARNLDDELLLREFQRLLRDSLPLTQPQQL